MPLFYHFESLCQVYNPALFNKPDFNAHSESSVWLVRANYDQDVWQTYIILRDASGSGTSDFKTFSLLPGNYYFRLTMIADNATSASKEIKVTVSPGDLELPKLETIQ
jgi:hypothetical protein